MRSSTRRGARASTPDFCSLTDELLVLMAKAGSDPLEPTRCIMPRLRMTCRHLSTTLRSAERELRKLVRAVTKLYACGWSTDDLRYKSLHINSQEHDEAWRITSSTFPGNMVDLPPPFGAVDKLGTVLGTLLAGGLLEHLRALIVCHHFNDPYSFSLKRIFSPLKLGSLPALRVLNLEGNHLREAHQGQQTGLSALCAALRRGAMPRLAVLRLSRTGLDDDGLGALADALVRGGQAAALRVLVLDENDIRDVSPLYPFGKLRHLSLARNLCHSVQVEELPDGTWTLQFRRGHPMQADWADFAAAMGDHATLPALKTLHLSPVPPGSARVPLKAACEDGRGMSCVFSSVADMLDMLFTNQ